MTHFEIFINYLCHVLQSYNQSLNVFVITIERIIRLIIHQKAIERAFDSNSGRLLVCFASADTMDVKHKSFNSYQTITTSEK